MGLAADEFVDEVDALLGPELSDLFDAPDKLRWINAGIRRLGSRYLKTGALTWSAGDLTVALPADFGGRLIDIKPTGSTEFMEQYSIVQRTLIFEDKDGAHNAGTATIYYYGQYPAVTATADSVMDASEDDAVISFCQYKVFTRLVNDRARHTRYATLTGQNGVNIDDLRQVARGHFDDFVDALNVDSLDPPEFFYGDG